MRRKFAIAGFAILVLAGGLYARSVILRPPSRPASKVYGGPEFAVFDAFKSQSPLGDSTDPATRSRLFGTCTYSTHTSHYHYERRFLYGAGSASPGTDAARHAYQTNVLRDLSDSVCSVVTQNRGRIVYRLLKSDIEFVGYGGMDAGHATPGFLVLYTCGSRTGWISFGVTRSEASSFQIRFTINEYPDSSGDSIRHRFLELHPEAESAGQLTK